MAKVTIATSVYNTELWLERCLNSLIHQTFTDLEIIIVDNASTDNSPEIIKRFAEADPRIRVITLKQNVGPGGGYGEAMKAIRTECFTFCDSDDYIDLNYIEVLYNKLIEADADLAMCTNDKVWADGRTEVNRRPGKDVILTHDDIPNILPQLLVSDTDEYLGYYLTELRALWGKLYRTDFMKENHLIYTQADWYYGDWFFHFKVFKHLNKMIYTEDTSYHWYQSEGSVTRSLRMDWNKHKYLGPLLSGFEAEAQDVMTPVLRKLLNRYYFNASMIMLYMYFNNYPDPVKKEDIISVCRELAGWDVMKQITIFHRDGVGYKNAVRLRLFKYKWYISYRIRKAKQAWA